MFVVALLIAAAAMRRGPIPYEPITHGRSCSFVEDQPRHAGIGCRTDMFPTLMVLPWLAVGEFAGARRSPWPRRSPRIPE